MECPPAIGKPDDPALDGAGQIVTVADTGFDRGDINNVHPAFQGRVKELFSFSRPNPNPDRVNDPFGWKTGLTNDPHGHGTHVSGSAVGKGDSKETGSVTGTAPGAQLIVQSLLNPATGQMDGPSRSTIMEEAFKEGSYISNHSFGTDTKEPYDADAEDVDFMIFRNPKLLISQAAGNAGDQGYTVAGCANSKNGITVGAVYNARQMSETSYNKDGEVGKPHNIVDYSNAGQAGADRLKPDVVAPGVCILSTASQDPVFQAEDKKFLGLFTIPGTRPLDKYGRAPNQYYRFSSGTSMAAPQVTGCLAVLRQALMRRNEHGGHAEAPNASLIKALLIHGATDISDGFYQKKPIGGAPNNIQGNGLVNMERSLAPIRDVANDLHGMWEDRVQRREEPVTFTRWTPSAPAGSRWDIDVTLVFTDWAGRKLQSVLSYDVRFDSGPMKGQSFSSPRREDNVLRLRCPDIPANTTFTILVWAKRLFQARPLSFSLVWSVRRK